MLDGLAIAQKVIHKTDILLVTMHYHDYSYLRTCYPRQADDVSQSKRLCLRFWAITKAMTRPITCRAIAQPFARLAIARFYVYGLIRDLSLCSSSIFVFNLKQGWVSSEFCYVGYIMKFLFEICSYDYQSIN